MELIFDILIYIVVGFFGLIALFVVFAVLFGKKVEKNYDLEVEFHDEKGREFAEFDLKEWRYEKEGGEFKLSISFKWRDIHLAIGNHVEVLLESQVVLAGVVEEDGKIRLNSKHLVNKPQDPKVGQQCQIKLDGEVVLEKGLVKD